MHSLSLALILLLCWSAVSPRSTDATPYNIWLPQSLDVDTSKARAFHTAVVANFSCGPLMYVFGGILVTGASQFDFISDFYALNLNEQAWFPLWPSPGNAVPAARAGHTMVDMTNGKFILFGGYNGTGAMDDVWMLFADLNRPCSSFHTMATWSQPNVTCVGGVCPPARWGHGAVVLGKAVFVVGGTSTPWYNLMTPLDLALHPMTVWRLREVTTAAGTVFEWSVVPLSSPNVPPPRAGAMYAAITHCSFLMISG